MTSINKQALISFNSMPQEKVYRIGNDILLLDELVVATPYPSYFRTETTNILLLTAGVIKGRVNLQVIEVCAPAMVIIFPEQTLEFSYASEEAQGKILEFSYAFYERLGLKGNVTLRQSFGDQVQISMNKRGMEAMMLYVEMIKGLTQAKDNPFQMDSAINLTRAFFYGAGYYFHQTIEKRQLTRKEEIVARFSELLAKHCSHYRTIEFYADAMNLSVKYISNVIKCSTGKTAGKLIEEQVIIEAKSLLATTNLTISQVSDRMNFPDSSTFGKYFKRLTGISPKTFRAQGTK
jgi:AraC-like DNA-binding protein